MSTNREKIIDFGVGILVIVISVFSVYYFFFSSNQKNEDTLKEVKDDIQMIKEGVLPYETKNSMEKLVLVENFENTAINGEQSSDERVAFTKKGTISGGYIYIRANVNNSHLDEYSKIYLKIIGKSHPYEEDGGLLVKNRSLSTPKEDNYTELLYKLSDVSYKEGINSRKVTSSNWLEIIDENDDLQVLYFSSTEGAGKIEEISIYYECLENTDCSLEK